MSRRLPIFFVVDVSESMAGEELYQMDQVMEQVLTGLRRDPYALETAWVSVIAFAGKAITMSKLTELVAFHKPELPVGGGTALGEAIRHLMMELDKQVTPTTATTKGDWRPLIFLLTDGQSTDDARSAIADWNARYRSRATLVAISVGAGADHAMLKSLTDDVIVFMDSTPDSFTRFAKWITMSISTQSRSVSTGDDGKVDLSKGLDNEILGIEEYLAHGGQIRHDERYLVMVGKCEKSKNPYLLKYARQRNANGQYPFVSATQLRNSYFDLTDQGEVESLNMMELEGAPNCPHCGAFTPLAGCGECGNIHCLNGPGMAMCPWCGATGEYIAGDSSDEFNVNRGRG